MSRLPLRVLVVEDEPLGYRRLEGALGLFPDVELVGWARTAKEASRLIAARCPNLVLLDIQIPGTSGMNLARRLRSGLSPKVVFVTAHDRHAVEAFDLEAVDYVLKPFTNERLGEALDRVRWELATSALVSSGSKALFPGSDAERSTKAQPTLSPYLARLSIERLGKMLVVPVDTIDRLRAEGVYTEIHVGHERYLLRQPLSSLEERLDPNKFCRIHRSEMVALNAVESYLKSGGRHSVQLKGGVTLPVGRSRRKELERRLGCL